MSRNAMDQCIREANEAADQAAHARMERDQVRRRKPVDWISVKDRLPDADMAVLLDYDGECWPGTYQGDRGNDRFWSDLTGMPIIAQVLHWAEFPEVP